MGVVTAGLVVAGVAAGAGAIKANQAKIAGRRAADSAGRAAMAQETAAQTQFRTMDEAGQKLQDQAVGEANRYSVQELRATDSAVATQGRYLAEQEKLLSAVNPALMEASQQALKLLRGDKAQSLGPLENQRAQQRQALQNSLRSQGLGDGSSAALNALSRFDSETANVLNNAQQGSLNTLLQTSLAANPNINAATSNLGALAGSYGNMANRSTQALLTAGGQRLGALSNAGSAVIGAAGSKFAGETLRQQANANYESQMSGQFMNLAGQAGGMAMGNYFGGASGGKLGAMGAGTGGAGATDYSIFEPNTIASYNSRQRSGMA